jgi:hypothetical protein
MPTARPAYESSARTFLVGPIADGPRERYRPPEELPPMWLRMLCRLDANPEAPDRDTKGKFEILT